MVLANQPPHPALSRPPARRGREGPGHPPEHAAGCPRAPLGYPRCHAKHRAPAPAVQFARSPPALRTRPMMLGRESWLPALPPSRWQGGEGLPADIQGPCYIQQCRRALATCPPAQPGRPGSGATRCSCAGARGLMGTALGVGWGVAAGPAAPAHRARVHTSAIHLRLRRVLAQKGRCQGTQGVMRNSQRGPVARRVKRRRRRRRCWRRWLFTLLHIA